MKSVLDEKLMTALTPEQQTSLRNAKNDLEVTLLLRKFFKQEREKSIAIDRKLDSLYDSI